MSAHVLLTLLNEMGKKIRREARMHLSYDTKIAFY